MSAQVLEKKLTKRNLWTYSFGGLRDCLYMLQSMFLLQYVQYTMNLTTSMFATITSLIVLCKVWDAINDPMMGTIIENAKVKGGKYRPWILLGAVLNSVITIALFTYRPEGWTFVAFFGVAYLLWGMTFTINDVGYWSLLPALSSNEKERNLLTTLMNVFISIGALATAAVLPMFLNQGDNISTYAVAAIAISLFFLFTQVVTFIGVKEPPRDESVVAEKVTLPKMVKIIKNNDQLLWASFVMFFYYLGSGLLIAFGLNFCNFEFGYDQGGSAYFNLTVAYALGTFISQALFGLVVKKFKRKGTMTLGAICAVLGYLVLVAFGYVLPASTIILIGGAFLVFFGQNFIYLTILVETTNTIEYNELKTGNRNEAIVFSLRSFLAKLTSALQNGLLGGLLIWSGVKSLTDKIANLESMQQLGEITKEQVIAQSTEITASATEGMKFALRVGIAVLPLIFIAICYFINQTKYKIDEEKYEEIVKTLEENRSNKL